MSWSHFVWAIMIKLLTTPSRLGHTVLRVLARCGPTLPRKAIKLFFLLHPKLCLWELIWCQDIDFPGFPGGSDCKVSACNVGDPGLISFRMDWLDLLAVQGTHKSLLQHNSSKASILLRSAFFIVQLSHPYMTTGKPWLDGPLLTK